MIKVLVPLAPGFEEIEAVTIIDILRRAEIDVTVAGLEKETIKGAHNIWIKCDLFYKDVDINKFDLLILPGGQPGTNNLNANETVLNWVKVFSESKKIIGAICAAPAVLHTANVIRNRKITSHPSEKFKFVDSNYIEENVVIDDNIFTSRGVGTAIEFALKLVSKIKGKKVSNELAAKILWK